MSQRGNPIKVAILGGGAGALSAAWALTERERHGQFEVTVYKMGWRLGGKGASGRNQRAAQRIEEHGLHMWFGFYENAFRVMRACYQEWRTDAPPGPIERCLGQAFIPQRTYVLNERRPDGTLGRWRLDLPDNGLTPGDGAPVAFADSLAATKLASLIEATKAFEEQRDYESRGVAPTRLFPRDDEERRPLEALRRRTLPSEERNLEGFNRDRAAIPASILLGAARDALGGGREATDLVATVELPKQPESVGDALRRFRFHAAVRIAARCFTWAGEL